MVYYYGKKSGDVLKWFKRPHSKCDRPVIRCEGSNPSISAKRQTPPYGGVLPFFVGDGGMRTREGASVSEKVLWTFKQRAVRRRPFRKPRTKPVSKAKQAVESLHLRLHIFFFLKKFSMENFSSYYENLHLKKPL